jgi:hypothetical protein
MTATMMTATPQMILMTEDEMGLKSVYTKVGPNVPRVNL